MPNNVDFSVFKNIKTLEVNPEGWISPLFVEYAIEEENKIYGLLSFFWRVKGTQHTFVIPVIRMDFLSEGDYKKHFENALQVFREDFIDWKTKELDAEWVGEYYRQFNKFIVI